MAEFTRAARVSIDTDSLTARNPPEPDILCSVAGAPIYFELARLLDQGMQRLKLRMLQQAPNPVPMNLYAVQLPEREVLKRKLAKNYSTSGCPVELVLYYDNQSQLVGDVPVFGDDEFRRHADHVMAPLIDSSRSTFRRVWVFERHRRHVLWTYPVDTTC